MDSTKWQHIKDILSATLDLPQESRAEFLKNQKDDEIRIEVEKLLEAHDKAENFIDKPFLIEHGVVQDDAKDSFIGKQIEDYLILERIGTGGMGAVYLAERLNSDFKPKVALKIIKRGMDSEAILKRFARERRILSTLKHTNIAALLDGGISSDGLPFFVMEFVDGKPLNQFCSENNISLEERLEIFRQICAAVEYAHKNLIVHRDLKPSNILVGEDKTPKLLDFGIAKLLSDEDIEATATQGKMFTPEYASPEQVLGKTVTTGTDVYSLGVILYELLSSHRPFDVKGKSYEEIIKSVCETEPLPPSMMISDFGFRISDFESKTKSQTKSTKNQREETNPQAEIRNPKLKGDLDNIILKALRKEPLERYGSAQQFSEDVSRFLQGLPVLARPQTLGYRFGKYVNRHKAGVLASALVLLSLVGGISVATWQAVVARRERAKAEQRFNDVRKLANAVIFDYHDSVEKLSGATALRERMVRDAAEYLDRLATESNDDISLQTELAAAYDRLGDVEGSFFGASLRNTKKAKEFYQKSLNLREKLYLQNPEDNNLRNQMAVSYGKLADIEFGNGNQNEAVGYYKKVVSLNEEMLKSEPANKVTHYDLAKAYRNLAVRGRTPNNTDENLALCRKAISILDELLSQNPDELTYRESRGDFYDGVAAILETNSQRRREAIQEYNNAIAIRIELVGKHPNNANLRQKLAMSYSYLGDTFYELSDNQNAIENYRKCLKILDELANQDSKNEQLKQDQAAVRGSLGISLAEIGKTEESIENLKVVLTMFERKFRTDTNDALTHYKIGMAQEGLGKAYKIAASNPKLSYEEKIKNWRTARFWYLKSLEIYKLYRDKIIIPQIIGSEMVESVAKAIAECDKEINNSESRKAVSRTKSKSAQSR